MRLPTSHPLRMPLAVCLLLNACAGAPRPCASANGCAEGTECLASRCVLAGTFPVDPRSDRVVLTPRRMAVARRNGGPFVGPSVTLGNAASAPTALYLSFPDLPRGRDVHSAFLLLERADGSLRGGDVELEVSPATDVWSERGFTWADRPRTGSPAARAIARSSPPLPVRIDVTELVRLARENPSRSHGVVVEATSERGAGVTLSTGVGGGAPPRLDVYLSRAK